MNLKIELHYAVLVSLLMLLWLSTEFVLGFQDIGKYIAYQPYVNTLAIIIPVICFRMALVEKLDESNGKLTFRQAFFTGFKITLLSALFSIPVQIIFIKLINPDFFKDMIQYAVNTGRQTKETAAMFFNSGVYVGETVVITLISGTVIATIWAWRMRTVN